MCFLTIWWLQYYIVSLTPACRVNVNTVRLAPVIVATCPAIKVDQQSLIFNILNSSNSCERRIYSVLSFYPHSSLERCDLIIANSSDTGLSLQPIIMQLNHSYIPYINFWLKSHHHQNYFSFDSRSWSVCHLPEWRDGQEPGVYLCLRGKYSTWSLVHNLIISGAMINRRTSLFNSVP